MGLAYFIDHYNWDIDNFPHVEESTPKLKDTLISFINKARLDGDFKCFARDEILYN